jgi:hypothetical protein
MANSSGWICCDKGITSGRTAQGIGGVLPLTASAAAPSLEDAGNFWGAGRI